MSDHGEDLMAVLPYALELDRQCRLALAASDQMAASAEVFWPIATPQSVVGDFFDYAQRFLSSAAAISKILYATGKPARETRARHLRSMLALAEESPLANWSARNALEHIDERIDTWVKENPGAVRYSPFGISRTGQVPPDGTMRHYDSESDRLRVWDDEVELQPIVDAVRDVHAHVSGYLCQEPCSSSGAEDGHAGNHRREDL